MSWLEIFSRIAPSAADPDIVIVRPWLFRSARALCARSGRGGGRHLQKYSRERSSSARSPDGIDVTCSSGEAEGGAHLDGTMDDPDGWDLSDGDDGTEPAPVDRTPSADHPTADDDFAREVLAAQERRESESQRPDTLGDPPSDDDADDDDADDEDDSEHHGGWDDFSIKTPWERAVHNIESVVRRWLRLSDEDLAAQSSRCARPEHGGRDLRCLRTLIHHKMDHFRPDPYLSLIHI